MSVKWKPHTTHIYRFPQRSAMNHLKLIYCSYLISIPLMCALKKKETVGALVLIGAVKQRARDGESGGGLSALQCRINGVDSKV